KAEQQPGCPNTGDESTIEQAVDTGIASIIALAPAIALCPSTANLFDACGSCGNGECFQDGSTLACIDFLKLAEHSNGLCSTDSDCPTASFCFEGICTTTCP